jgi:outer membrane protein assembly factor BamB
MCRKSQAAWLHGVLKLLLVTLALPLMAEDWPQWRGPNRNGISTEKGWLDQWPSDGPPIAWKAAVGMGFSSFAVAGGRVYTMGNSDGNDTIFCLDATTGKELWKHSYPADLGDKFFEGGTTGTPTVDEGRVFALSRWGDLFCLDAATGKMVWTNNLPKQTGVRIPVWGFSGAPTVLENLLLLNVGEAGMALDKATGKLVWQSANKEAGYSTPLPWRHNGSISVLLGSGTSYLAVEPHSGKELWRIRWLTQYGVNAADPVLDGELVFISSGYGKGAALLKPGAGPEPELVWKSKVLRTQLNAAVLIGGYLYGGDGDASDKPALKCIAIADGKEQWSEPGVSVGALMAAEGKLIIMGDHGELVIAPASPKGFQPTARAQVLGGKCWTAPVLANGFIYCRNSRGDVAALAVRPKTR